MVACWLLALSERPQNRINKHEVAIRRHGNLGSQSRIIEHVSKAYERDGTVFEAGDIFL